MSKVLIQINQKIGGTAWEVIQSENSLIGKSVVVHGGLAISKGKKGYTLSFVGSINKNGTKFKTFNKTGYKIKDAFPEEDISKMFTEWFRSLFRNGVVAK